MALCEYLLNGNIDNSCDIIGGLREIGYIANKSDITGYTESSNTISALTFDTGKLMYKIYTPTKTPFTGSNTALEESDIVNRFTNTVSFVILENDATTAGIIEKLANGKFVVVLHNEYEGTSGASAYSVYGIERGLRATEITRDPYADETAGGWQVTMTETGAAKSEHFFYVTSLANTTSTLEGYCTPVVPNPNDGDNNGDVA